MNLQPNLQPAYITIVEGPPPEFQLSANRWATSVVEGLTKNNAALVEMRTFNGPQLMQRCRDAWADKQSARLDFPIGDGTRAELEIVAAQWEDVEEGHKLYLWVRIEGEIDEIGLDADIDADIDDDTLGIF